jgi:hypothetical protein
MTAADLVGVSRPVFDPDSSLGWRDVALDGLSCYLRCVEAVLHYRGYDSDAVTQALAGPVDLLRRRAGSDFDGCSVRWHNVDDGRKNWPEVYGALRVGDPVIIMPDRFYWSGDEFEGKRHFHDHMVLGVRIVDEMLFVLDTDAPPSAGFLRSIPIDDNTRRSCTRVGVVTAPPPPPAVTADALARQWLVPSVEMLTEDIATLERFRGDLTAEKLPYLAARGFHVLVLGDFQPVLFLFGSALGRDMSPHLEGVVDAAVQAAAKAKRLGLLLLALHRFERDDVYGMACDALASFTASLRVLNARMAEAGGFAVPPSPVDAPDLWERLLDVTGWCFDPDGTLNGSGTRLGR